jgi:plasmid stability protein
MMRDSVGVIVLLRKCAMARKPTELRPLMLRIPEALRKRIEVEATKNDRSMNAEIIHRLQDSFQKEERAALIQEAAAEAAANSFSLLVQFESDPNGAVDPEFFRGLRKYLQEAKQRRENAGRGLHEGPSSPTQPRPLGNHPRQPRPGNRKAET